MKIFRTRPN